MLPSSVLLELKKLHYVRSLWRFSEEDERDIKIVKHIVKPGDHVVDIGANIGWYTKTLSGLVGDQGRVYSIEPIQTTFKLLAFCVKKLRLSNVALLNCGISEKNGSAIMEVPEYATGGENYYQARIVTKGSGKSELKRYRIDLKSLDSLFLDSPERIQFIKCDVEGHELPVIAGATKLLTEFKPAWLIEISGDPDSENSDTFKLFSMLGNDGYTVWWFDGLQLRRRSPGDKSVNYFFLMNDHIVDLKRQEVSIAQ
jgi:FkbM family methyltransferase